MFNNLSFNKRFSIYLLIVFLLFTFIILWMQFDREKDFRKRQLENTLDNITEISNKYIQNQRIIETRQFALVDSIVDIFPQENIRLTVIDADGVVLYDSEVHEVQAMENHLKRPELQLALRNDFGSNIRSSTTTGNEYFYYSKYYSNYYLRTAALYDIEIKDFLKAEQKFILYLIAVFVSLGIVLLLITNRISKTIIRLKDFAVAISNGEKVEKVDFPSGELGVVSSEIVNIYNQLDQAKDSLSIEKNKLFNHLHALNEGVGFFSNTKQKLFTNNHFIHYLNLISDKTSISAEDIFKVEAFKPLHKFIDDHSKNQKEIHPDNLPKFEYELFKNSKYFIISCIFFEDYNFEILIKDISKLEKRKLIKQQMTSNFAHELKTPAASILGYLETLNNNKIDNSKKAYFIGKAFKQAKKLSELLNDLFTLNRIEETKNNIQFEKVNLYDVIMDVEENLQESLQGRNIQTKIKLPKKSYINGNKSLLFSVFHNLYDNAIKYGGEANNIVIDNYSSENDFLHFSFANTGSGIEEKHLARIFERFYRVDSGRSRKSGGTGLGLAIVKNAIQLHGGNITARNYKKGGLEFLFTLRKNNQQA